MKICDHGNDASDCLLCEIDAKDAEIARLRAALEAARNELTRLVDIVAEVDAECIDATVQQIGKALGESK